MVLSDERESRGRLKQKSAGPLWTEIVALCRNPRPVALNRTIRLS